jgi:indolepyruvate ferredoxin oxidoreductase beta subunit
MNAAKTGEGKVTNILVSGIGGQGVMTAAEVLSQTALSQGYDVKKTEVATAETTVPLKKTSR